SARSWSSGTGACPWSSGVRVSACASGVCPSSCAAGVRPSLAGAECSGSGSSWGLPELCFSLLGPSLPLLGPSLPLPGTVACDEDVGRDVFGDGADEVSAAFAGCWAGSLSKSMMLTAPAAMAAVAAILAIVTLRAEAPAATPVVLAAVPPPVANPLVLPPGVPAVVPKAVVELPAASTDAPSGKWPISMSAAARAAGVIHAWKVVLRLRSL